MSRFGFRRSVAFGRLLAAVVLAGIGVTQAPTAAAQAAATTSRFTPRVTVGGCKKWDLVGTDVPGRRFYVPCDDHVVAFDMDKGTLAANLTGFKGASAIAVASALHKGFVNDGGALTVFNTQTGQVIRSLPDIGGDAIAYEAATHRVFTFNDTTHVVDAETLQEVGTVRLNYGKPESAVADGKGHVYIALEHANQLGVIDARSLKLTRWSLGDRCYVPRTVVVDTAFQRVLVGCLAQNIVLALDARSGKIVASVPLGGQYIDQADYDDKLHLLVHPSADHVITLIRVSAQGALTVVDTLRTSEPTARNVGVDPVSHRAFFAVVEGDYFHPKPETFGLITLPLGR